MLKLKKNRSGFTLIEIIVVIVILAVLMAVAVPSVMSYINEANDAKYIAIARAAMINTQAQFTKAYIEKDDYEKENSSVHGDPHPACVKAKQLTNQKKGAGTDGVDVSTIRVYEKDSTKPMEKYANPDEIDTYVIWFVKSTDKVAIVKPNKNVKIESRNEAKAHYSQE